MSPRPTIPVLTVSRGVATSGRYHCYYCWQGLAMREADLPPGVRDALAVVTLHDRRGCFHLCWAHTTWRSTTSMLGGHSDDCPHKGQL
jgi:hypothetical protein